MRSKRGVWRCSWLQVTLPGSWRLAVGGVDECGGGLSGRRGGLGMGAVSERDRGGDVGVGDRGCALGVVVLW